MVRIAIIGAGAAGCFAAANIPFRKGREVVVFEKTGKLMQKVKISGGGRCNVTHACFEVPELLDRYPRGKALLRKSLYRFTPQHTIDWFETRGVALKAEADGRMFPVTDDSQTIIDAITEEMRRCQADVRYHKQLTRIERAGTGFVLHFSDTGIYAADKVLVACGGFPKKEQYHWLEALGHTVNPPVPSLFTFNMPGHPITGLMGLSVPDATVKVAGTKFTERGPLLITHWGMSGPAVLKTSARAARELHERQYHFTILVQWVGDLTESDVRSLILRQRQEAGRQALYARNPFSLPRRLWEYQLVRAGIGEGIRWGDLPAGGQNSLVEQLVRDAYEVKGKTTFKEEFVTSGGITLPEVDGQTMESRIVPGLYFAGEILDVDGVTGGFNFQHAWSSGRIAAESVMRD